MEWSEQSIILEETKKSWIALAGEAICSVTEGWILASKLNCSRFVLPYPTTFIIQRAKPFCGYVYCVRFSPYYMYWTDQDRRSKPLVKQRDLADQPDPARKNTLSLKGYFYN